MGSSLRCARRRGLSLLVAVGACLGALASPMVQANCAPLGGGALSLSSSVASVGPLAQDPPPPATPDAAPVDAMSEARQALAATVGAKVASVDEVMPPASAAVMPVPADMSVRLTVMASVATANAATVLANAQVAAS